jgi:hypothetical protein
MIWKCFVRQKYFVKESNYHEKRSYKTWLVHLILYHISFVHISIHNFVPYKFCPYKYSLIIRIHDITVPYRPVNVLLYSGRYS